MTTKTIALALLALTAAVSGCEGCGYTSVDNTMAGQVKKVHHNTPIICENYVNADVSLGIMQNGVGSISTHDVQMTIPDSENVKMFEQAALTGRLVEVTFKERRSVTCIDYYVVTGVKFLDSEKPSSVTNAAAKTTETAKEAVRTVEVSVDGHTVTGQVVSGRVVSVQLDGKDAPIDGAMGRAAASVVSARLQTEEGR